MEDGATAAEAVSKVLGDDDLLDEILVRVGFPTSLVRAAAVCKRWLHHASDKAFLSRFRKLNPPRILGFYIQKFQEYSHFVPMLPQAPELAAAVRIVKCYSFGADDEGIQIKDCRNGSVSTVLRSSRLGSGVSVGVHNPLCPKRSIAVDRPLSPQQQHPLYRGPHDFLVLCREEKDGGLSFFSVLLENHMELDITSATNFTAHVFILKGGVWCMIASATTRIDHWRRVEAVLVDNKIYMLATYSEITVLDLTTSTFSTIQLPRGVGDFRISRADDASSVYLIGVKEHQLGIWLYKGDSWSIVDTICLHEICASLMKSDSRVRITHVGDNAEFVLFQMDRFALYLDTRCRTLCTLYEIPEDEYISVLSTQPFMMIWPPTFPALKCDPTRNAM